MFRFTGLSENLIHQTLLRIATRFAISIPLQVISLLIVMLGPGQFRSDPVLWNILWLMCGVSAIRLGLWVFGARILQREHGQVLFRSIFTIGATLTGACWGFAFYEAWSTFGEQIPTLFIWCAAVGVNSTVLAAWSFDLFAVLCANTLFTLPPTVVLFMYPHSHGIVMACTSILWYVFVCLSAQNVNKIQWTLLRNFEALAEKDRQLEAAHQTLHANHTLIQSMLESINEAFLIFNDQGYCTSYPSKIARDLLGVDPLNKHISEIIEPKVSNRKSVSDWFTILFFDRLDFQECAARGLQRIETNQGKTILNLKFHPMRDENQKLKSVIFTASEVTKEVQAQMRSEAERERADMILRIFENKPSFRSFLTNCDTVIQMLCKWDGEDLETVQRELHTLKGTAMLFGAAALSRNVYNVEIAIRDHKGNDLPNCVREAALSLREKFVIWRSQEMNLFTKLGVFEDGNVEISFRKLVDLKEKLSRTENPQIRAALESVLQMVSNTEFGDLLKDFDIHLNSTASKLGKKVTFKVIDPERPIYIQPSQYRDTCRTFIHMMNNAIDHGIEAPAERKAKGKPEVGSITIRYEQAKIADKKWLKILVEDDGGGIRFDKIREKLVAKGQSPDPTQPDLELAMHIFDEGMTTKADVSELSGQGVGMGAVRIAVLKLKGKIRISKSDSSGTVIEILLPDHSIPEIGLRSALPRSA